MPTATRNGKKRAIKKMEMEYLTKSILASYERSSGMIPMGTSTSCTRTWVRTDLVQLDQINYNNTTDILN